MSTHITSTSRYLNNNASVVTAGRQLQKMLGEDFETLEFAITQLEEAAKDQDTGTERYRAFMFSALEGTKETQKETRQRISGDILATVLADLQVGSVFVAAGQAVGETERGEADVQAGRHLLDEALNSLEETTPAIARGLSTPISGGAKPGRFNFSGTPVKAQQQAIASLDAKSAVDIFRSLSEQTMGTFVSEFREVTVSVFEALKKPMKELQIMDVLEKLGVPLKVAGGMIGRLIKKGIEKIQSAVDALVNLIGNDAITKIRDRIKGLWNEIGKKKLDEWGNEVLGEFIGVEATQKIVEDVLGGNLEKEIVDKATNELSQLKQPYKDNMEMAKKAVGAISLVSGVLFVLPIAGQKVALFAAVSYFVILTGALLIAMDYCDSGRILQRVRGVGEIANSLRVPVKTSLLEPGQ